MHNLECLCYSLLQWWAMEGDGERWMFVKWKIIDRWGRMMKIAGRDGGDVGGG